MQFARISRQSGNQRATAELPTSAAPSTHGSGQAKLHSRRLAVLLAAPLLLAAGLLLTLLLVSQPAAVFIPGFPFSGAVKRMGAPAPDRMLSLLAGRRTNATMAVLPPFDPTCFVIHELRERVQCPVIDCSLDVSCSTRNTSCCSFINLQMMLFFDQYLASKGFEGQYTLVYGSVMGAVRNKTVLAHTSDVDFGFTPIVAQFLEQNSTKQELFSYGYSLGRHNGVAHVPAPAPPLT